MMGNGQPKKRKKRKRRKKTRFPLREVLSRLGMSQRECAKRCGMTAGEIHRIYHGDKIPTWTTIRLMMTSIGASLGDLTPRGGE